MRKLVALTSVFGVVASLFIPLGVNRFSRHLPRGADAARPLSGTFTFRRGRV